MIKIEAKTKLSPEEVIKRAAAFFTSGYGLKMTEQTPTSVCLEGGGGRVMVTVRTEAKGTSVEVESQEWDRQAREFIKKLA
ncbi:MAG: hypothetical protein HW402_1237 [Dehalococcoidales bacterium]|nr:hypothetical protein [Dehalococcoidales bacterium]